VGELTTHPRPLAGFKGPTSKGRGRERRGAEGRRGEGREGGVERRERGREGHAPNFVSRFGG